MSQNKEVKVVAGAFNKVVLDVVELAKKGWEVEKGNSITLIGGSMKVLMYKENKNNNVGDQIDDSNKLGENTVSEENEGSSVDTKTKPTTRKRQTKTKA